jgi:hypothetical protein
MKFLFKISLMLFLINFSAPNVGAACEFLKEEIGTPILKIIEKYDYLDDPTYEGSESFTLVKEYDSLSLCDNSELEDTLIKVFVKEGKIIATEIEGSYGEAKNGKILNFAKIYLGYSTEEDIDEKWTGGTTLSSFGENVVYERVEFIDGNYETLTISKPEFKQFLFGPNVQEIMM